MPSLTQFKLAPVLKSGYDIKFKIISKMYFDFDNYFLEVICLRRHKKSFGESSVSRTVGVLEELFSLTESRVFDKRS